MPHPAGEANSTLPALLARRARNASDTRLALDLGVGLLAAVALVILRPPAWWLLASAALCFAAFGGWGIADREMIDVADPRARAFLRAARIAAVVLGSAALAVLLFGSMAVALGRWAS